jgi:hypothetical protein
MDEGHKRILDPFCLSPNSSSLYAPSPPPYDQDYSQCMSPSETSHASSAITMPRELEPRLASWLIQCPISLSSKLTDKLSTIIGRSTESSQEQMLKSRHFFLECLTYVSNNMDEPDSMRNWECPPTAGSIGSNSYLPKGYDEFMTPALFHNGAERSMSAEGLMAKCHNILELSIKVCTTILSTAHPQGNLPDSKPDVPKALNICPEILCPMTRSIHKCGSGVQVAGEVLECALPTISDINPKSRSLENGCVGNDCYPLNSAYTSLDGIDANLFDCMMRVFSSGMASMDG